MGRRETEIGVKEQLVEETRQHRSRIWALLYSGGGIIRKNKSGGKTSVGLKSEGFCRLERESNLQDCFFAACCVAGFSLRASEQTNGSFS